MTSIGTTSIGGTSTAAIILLGTSGAADADLELVVSGTADISVEFSSDGVTWSTGNGSSMPQSILVPAGTRVRLRNANAGARVAFVAYRYLGTPN